MVDSWWQRGSWWRLGGGRGVEFVGAFAEDGEDGVLADGEVGGEEGGVDDFNGGESGEVLELDGGD